MANMSVSQQLDRREVEPGLSRILQRSAQAVALATDANFLNRSET
jgi:hypothetical protein